MTTTATDLTTEAERHRRELIGYCYRFFGSYAEAEDAVQETFERVWRRADDFRGEASLRTWLHRIATNVCIDMQRSRQRRALPIDLSGPGSVATLRPEIDLAAAPAETWIGPIGDAQMWGDAADPAERVASRDSVRLAFLTALQVLPPKQRAVLLLRDVLAWSAEECADLLDTSVDSVTSALARARRTVGDRAGEPAARPPADDELTLLRAYVAAFEAYDVDALTSLVAADAEFTMPPIAFWLRGATEIEAWWRGPGDVCRGSRVIPTAANGLPAAAVYHPVADGVWEPFNVQVLRFDDAGRIAAITHFMGADVFAEMGLPALVTDRSAESS